MGKLEQYYRRAAPFTVSFDWNDHLTNTGYKRYYPCASNVTGGPVFFLSTQQVDSNPVYDQTAAELNFDVEFKRAVTIRGEAVINSTISGSGAANVYYTTFIIYHVDTGASETSIGTAQTENHTGAAPGFWRDCTKLTVTETRFAIGEKLRFAATAHKDGGTVTLYHDPTTNLTFTEAGTARTIGSDITFDVPFKLVI